MREETEAAHIIHPSNAIFDYDDSRHPRGSAFRVARAPRSRRGSQSGFDLRYLLLSDIHANLEALEVALAAAEGEYDQILCLGDIVGYGPEPNQAVERVRDLTPNVIRGNHDKACCGLLDAEDFNPVARYSTEWTRGQLTPQNYAFLYSLPAGPLQVGGFALVHGSPLDEDEYLSSPIEALPAMLAAPGALTFFGHTHVQGGFLRDNENRFRVIHVKRETGEDRHEMQIIEGWTYLVNPGSIGQPRDGDPRAGFAVYDEARRIVRFWRVEYNVKKIQAKITDAGLPLPLAFRLEIGR